MRFASILLAVSCGLAVTDVYKRQVYAYACIYKADTEKIDLIPAAELTITFVCYHYPRAMLDMLPVQPKDGTFRGLVWEKV